MNALLLALVLLADGGRPERVHQVACIELNNYYATAGWRGHWQVIYWEISSEGKARIIDRRGLAGPNEFQGWYDQGSLTAHDRFRDWNSSPPILVQAPCLIETRTRGDPDMDDFRVWGPWYRRRLR